MSKITLMEELETDTPIQWWNENRKQLNEVIIAFNEWQVKYEFNDHKKEVVKALITLCRKIGKRDSHSYSQWQFDILDDLEEYIKDYEENHNDNY